MVVLWGGFDAAGVALHNGELFDPESGTLVPIDVFLPPLDMGPPLVEVSLPHAGATDVPVDIVLALRFSEPLLADTVNVATVTLFGPDGAVAARLVPAEGGMLLFVSPLAPLRAGGDYTLALSSLLDGEGLALPLTEVSFTTAGRAGGDALRSSEKAGFGAPAASADKESPSLDPRDAPPGGVWVPSAGNLKGDWRINLPPSPWQSLPSLQARRGDTALAGQVLRVDGWPLAKVSLQIGKRQVKTDETGRFLLPKLEAGRHMLVVDARPASTRSTTYGLFMVAVDIIASETTVMPQTIWMPVIDIAHAITVPSPTTAEVVATTPLIPGLEVRIPAGTILRQFDGRAATTITISPIPIDRAPFPLPPDAGFPVYFTIQPGGTRIEAADGSESPGMRIVYPNYSDIPAGSEVQTYSYDAGGQGWFVLGKSRVVPGGASVVPEPGVAYHVFTCSGDIPAAQAGAVAGGVTGGEPVDLATGLFVLRKTDLFLPDVIPLALTRTYEPSDSVSRSFGIGSRHAYDLFLASAAADDCQYVDLLLPDGARIRYFRQSGGCTNAVMFPHTSSPTEFHGSRLERVNFSLWRITLRDGTVYDFSGLKLDRIQDRHGNTVRIFRDSSHQGRITKILSPNGRWIEFSYTDPGYNRVTEGRDNIGRIVGYAYNDVGRLWKVTDAKGGETTYEYAPDGCRGMRTITDARHITFLTNEYRTDRCAVARQTVAGYPPYTFTYVEATLCCGFSFEYPLYACGNCTGGLRVGACQCVQRPYYEQVLITDPGGTVRRVTFDPDTGYPLTDTHADGTSDAQTVTYNDGISNRGLISSVTDSLARRTELTYDETGLPRSITRLAGTPNALTTTFTYEPRFKQLETIVEPPTRLTQFHYDSGRLIGKTDATERLTGISLTPQGQLRTISDADGTTQFAYEGADLVQIIDPGGNTTTRFVDAGGRVRSVTDPLGHRTVYDYDALNNLTRITDPLGGIVELDYDPNSNLQVVRDRRRSIMRETVYFYDAMDRLSQRLDPLARSEYFSDYDFAGNLGKHIDRRGKVTRFGYDRLGRLTFAGFGATGPDATPTYDSTIDYEYDGGHRPTKLVDVDNVAGTIRRIIRGYDGLDHLTCESKGTSIPCSTSQPDAVTYTYAPATGRRASMTVSGQALVTYGYDDADRLQQVTQGTTSVTITPDALGRRGTVLLPNSFSMVYGYDSNSRVSSIQYKKGTTVIGGLTYTPDAAGNVIQVGGEWTRTGLPPSATAAYHTATNQLQTWNGVTLGYDANGNLQSDGTRTYAWDSRNQLASVSGSPSLTFQYDAFGRRTQRAPSGFFSSGFLYDGLNPVAVTTGSTTTGLLTGLNIDDLFAATEGSTTKPFLIDALGSTLTLADPNANPPTQPTYTYEPFGKSSLAGGTPFQFTGRENEGIGLYYYRARYYQPTFGRFISEDPLGTAALVGAHQDLNSSPSSFEQVGAALTSDYLYAENSPTTNTDPLGLCPAFTRVPPGFQAGSPRWLISSRPFGARTGMRTFQDIGNGRLLEWKYQGPVSRYPQFPNGYWNRWLWGPKSWTEPIKRLPRIPYAPEEPMTPALLPPLVAPSFGGRKPPPPPNYDPWCA